MKATFIEKIFQLSLIEKAINYKNGALTLMSIPLSLGYTSIFNKLFENVEPFDLILPIVSITVLLLMYLFFWIIDFVLGLVASKHESKGLPDWVESNKLYNSIGKIGGMMLINMTFMIIIVFLVVVGFVKVSVALLIVTVLINVLGILYEFHSIGENIKRRTGSKPKMFTFFEGLANIVETRIIERVNKII